MNPTPTARRPRLASALWLALLLPLHDQAQTPLDPGTVLGVTLGRGACFGTCPIYQVAASRDGAVSFDGEDFVEQRGKHAGRISAEAFAAIVAKAVAVRFLSLRDSYASQEDGCAEMWTDHPSMTITLRLAGGGSKSVNYYEGCEGPAVLKGIAALADVIDRQANTAQWIGKPGESL